MNVPSFTQFNFFFLFYCTTSKENYDMSCLSVEDVKQGYDARTQNFNKRL